MNLNDFDKPKTVVDVWGFPSRTTPGKEYVVSQFTDGSFECKDNDDNMCWGDIQAKKAGTGRCRHVGGVLKALGDPVPREEAKIEKRIEEAVSKVARPHRVETHFDREQLVSRRMACTSLEAWRDALFQETLDAKQGVVLKYIMNNPGCTDKEIAAGIGWPINTVTPRRGELMDTLIRQKGVKENDTGRNAMTWEATSLAMELSD